MENVNLSPLCSLAFDFHNEVMLHRKGRAECHIFWLADVEDEFQSGTCVYTSLVQYRHGLKVRTWQFSFDLTQHIYDTQTGFKLKMCRDIFTCFVDIHLASFDILFLEKETIKPDPTLNFSLF